MLSDRPIVVCYPFIGDKIGGSHISTIKLVQGLDTQRIRPIVAVHEREGDLAPLLDCQGLDVIPAPDVEILATRRQRRTNAGRVSNLWNYFTDSIPRMKEFLIAHGIEIVHTNDGRMHATWAAAARAARVKLLWHHRGDPGALGVNTLAPVLANHIVTVSRFARPRHPILPVGHKWSVVHSPFEHPTATPDRAEARKALIEELRCLPDTRFLGYFGVLNVRKRPVAFVEIVHAFKQAHPEIPVTGLLFGKSAPDGPQLEDAVRSRADELGIGDRIHLMGFRQPIEPYMCAVDALLVPALNEPFGRTLIEAMMLGTPVVATNHGGNREAIEDGRTGFLVEAENPNAFIAPVHHLMSDSDCWRHISEAARHWSLSSFGLAKHVEMITEIYENLVHRSVRRTAPTQADCSRA